ncbi:MAG TPA: hypothetical protein VH189_01515 [Rhizomicrobium sp.]|nr:hypothetical protein [Rhizomicrobium sp.]
MVKKKLLQDIKQHPGRIYRTPNDVLRDRRFSDGERLEILRSWRDEAPGEDSGIGTIIAELEQRLCNDHAAE